ncbi:protein degradation protein, DER1 (nucleomorph) [Chroomonas mesostigmatica CCMP1168]|uniref:Derlin n=1 Tax=Chroomonas mesostigmatica CCMP1168 TaxID=1195612 RepID=J7G1S3_9CRYP|nr:protein degradation protein, DER1 [Chroomonas mesostigmatica CCMP1168]|mmetsp:Transcript_66772/g.164584  ORF Transcript_66772/g.164584 Transcript_66772/m.164584 type:complete len:216 (+) Transcript_66772:57-704(+)
MDFGNKKTFLAFPPITNTYLILSLSCSILVTSKILKSEFFNIHYRLIVYYHQVYRFISPTIFFGKLGFKSCMMLYMFIRFSKTLEASHFEFRQADYLYSLIITNVLTALFKLHARSKKNLSASLVGFSIFMWGRKNSQKLLHLVGLIHLKGKYVTFLFFGISFFFKQRTLKLEIMGAACAAIFDFLTERCPRINGGQDLIRTPKVFRLFFKTSKI